MLTLDALEFVTEQLEQGLEVDTGVLRTFVNGTRALTGIFPTENQQQALRNLFELLKGHPVAEPDAEGHYPFTGNAVEQDDEGQTGSDTAGALHGDDSAAVAPAPAGGDVRADPGLAPSQGSGAPAEAAGEPLAPEGFGSPGEGQPSPADPGSFMGTAQ